MNLGKLILDTKLDELNVAQRTEHLPKGHILYHVGIGPCTFNEFLKDRKVISIFFGAGVSCGTVFYVDQFGKTPDFGKEGEILLYPSKEMRDWSKFLAPGKEMAVMHGTDDSSVNIAHLAGKWFKKEVGQGPFEEVEPSYIAEGKNWENLEADSIETILAGVKRNLNLQLDVETLEWSEVPVEAELIELSDGTAVPRDTEIVVTDDFKKMTWKRVEIKGKSASDKYPYQVRTRNKKIGYYKHALPLEGNEWRIDGYSKLKDSEPVEQPKKYVPFQRIICNNNTARDITYAALFSHKCINTHYTTGAWRTGPRIAPWIPEFNKYLGTKDWPSREEIDKAWQQVYAERGDNINLNKNKEYCIKITSYRNMRKLQCVKACKNTLKCGIVEAKDFIDSVPATYTKATFSLETATECKKIFEEAGATVEIVEA